MNPERLRKSPNIAIVGSTSLLGRELQEMLQDRGFPAGRLALLETEEYAGLLQEFAGEIQITQVISPDAFKDIDIAFFTISDLFRHVSGKLNTSLSVPCILFKILISLEVNPKLLITVLTV